MMSLFKRIIAVFAVLVIAGGGFVWLAGCSVDFREDSDVYSCYYYGLDGEDLTDEIVSYTLELRTDGSLITRYKTRKNSDSGRDEYYFDDGYLVVAAFYGKKTYDVAGNEIIIGDKIDGQFLLIKFRLTQSPNPPEADFYSFVSRKTSGVDESETIRYHVVGFYADGSFGMWMWSREERQRYQGTYQEQEESYQATDPDTGETWQFQKDQNTLTLNQNQTQTTFQKTT